MDYLSEKERSEVQKFLENKIAFEAVRKVLLSGVYLDGRLEADKPADPLKNFILASFTQPGVGLLPDSDMGAKMRSIINAVSMIETGFAELEKCRKVEVTPISKINKAR